MKLSVSPLVRRTVGLLPTIFMFASVAAQACPQTHPFPSMFQAYMATSIAASILIGTPFLAFGFINLLAGETRQGMIRILTFISAMGVAISTISALQCH